MDVEMQMEAKGLPTQFGVPSNQPDESHLTSNAAASLSNAESATMSEVKSSLESASQPSEAPEPDVIQPSVPASSSAFNEIAREQPADVSNFESTTLPIASTSQLPEPSDQSDPAINTASFNDSGISSSAPANIESIMTSVVEPKSATMTTLVEPAVIPQPPTSELRTSTHADNLTPAEIAEVQATKHEQDNLADAPQSEQIPARDSVEPAQVPSAAASQAEAEKVNETGLVTPPIPSPPPPVAESEHAATPANVTATQPEPAVNLLGQSQDTTPAQPDVDHPVQLEDQVMADAPTQTKIAREREDDKDEPEPAAKRIKADGETDQIQASEFKVPEAPVISSPQANGSPASLGGAAVDGDNSITAPRLAHMKKIVSNLKKSNASTAFRVPVDPIALNIPTYFDFVKKPMDLSTIDNKLKQNQYNTISEFIQDFEQIVTNCVIFNGKDHAVTQAAYKMQNSFNNQMSNLPKAAFAEPSREERKLAKIRQEPTRQAPPRRPSISTAPSSGAGGGRSPSAATQSTPFAVGPDGVPLIRRDSTMADGRPKRAIVPTKRNQDFAGGRPRKKKYELQLRFCAEVLKEIAAPKHWQLNQFFTHPVDPVALNIPTYFQIIKKPMDFETIQTKLNNNVYERAKEFEEDVRQVFKNCYKFNPESDWVNQAGHQLEEMFDKKWATKDDWIAAREPQSDPQSEEEDDEEEESEDDDDSEAERNDKIAALQKQIAEMSKQMGELTQKKTKKKSKSPSAPPKKSKSKSSKKEKPKTIFPGLQKTTEKKKSVSKPKPDRYVTFAEKQYISNGIGMLPEKQMQEALRIIQQSVPSLANSADGEIELDIEEVPNHALLKLLTFVRKYAGPPPDEPKADSDSFSGGVSKSKKGKPNKQEQEAQIEALRGQLGAYNGGPHSPNAIASIERDSSDDDGDSEESEEE